jgi:hypothetical protein
MAPEGNIRYNSLRSRGSLSKRRDGATDTLQMTGFLLSNDMEELYKWNNSRSLSFCWIIYSSSTSTAAKELFLSHSLPYNILPDTLPPLDHPVFTSLDFARAMFLQSKLVSFASNLEDNVSVFTYPGDRVTQLYSQAPGYFLFAFYDLESYGGDILPRFHTRFIYSYYIKLWESEQRSRYSDWLRVRGPKGQSSSSGRVRKCLLSTSARTVLGPSQPLSNGYRELFPQG